MDLLQEIGSLRGRMEAHPLNESFGVKYETLRALCDAAEAHLQPDLFAVPHQKKSATSAEAARRWRPKARSYGMMVLRCVSRQDGGVTREQVCKMTAVLNQTAAGRLNVLKSAGLIEARGKRRSKTTGFNQEIYYITQKGRDFLAREAA